ncbi:MAG: hypothetical protein DCC71_10100 [Proteobacteria bacterium]|nr:MAG: hypothetical protein DCC71_10100 [Pseudomonadota bacterium]
MAGAVLPRGDDVLRGLPELRVAVRAPGRHRDALDARPHQPARVHPQLLGAAADRLVGDRVELGLRGDLRRRGADRRGGARELLGGAEADDAPARRAARLDELARHVRERLERRQRLADHRVHAPDGLVRDDRAGHASRAEQRVALRILQNVERERRPPPRAHGLLEVLPVAIHGTPRSWAKLALRHAPDSAVGLWVSPLAFGSLRGKRGVGLRAGCGARVRGRRSPSARCAGNGCSVAIGVRSSRARPAAVRRILLILRALREPPPNWRRCGGGVAFGGVAFAGVALVSGEALSQDSGQSHGFGASIDRAAARWVAAVDRRPAWVVVLVLAATLGAGVYAARNLGVNADPDAMISGSLPFRERERDFQRSFRAAWDEMLVVVDGDSASSAGRAADAIAERLARHEDLFAKVQLMGGGPFFRRNALLYLELDELEELADRLATVQPFLAEIARDASAVGISDLLAKAVDAQRDGTDVGMDLGAALDKVRTSVAAAARGEAAPDPWGDALIGGSMSEDARHRVIAIRPRADFEELLFAEPAIAAIRADVAELGYGPGNESGIRVRLTGSAVLNYEELIVVETQGKMLALAALTLFTASVYFALRSWRVLFALVTSLVASLVWTNAFAAAAIGHLNQVSATFNVLIVGLGGELGIHVCMRYAELAAKGRSRPQALAETGGTMGSALFSSAVTTAIGFLVFFPTDYRGVAELGLIAGAGVVISLVSSLTLLPALLSLGAAERPRFASASLPAVAKLRHVPIVYARPIRWVAFALALGSLALVPQADFDHNPVNLRDPNTESVQAFEDLLARSSTSPWTVDWIVPDLEAAKALARELDELDVVERTMTLADFVPADQEEKRAVLDTMALLVPIPPPAQAPPGAAAQRAALARLDEALGRAQDTGDAAFQASAARLRETLAEFRKTLDSAPDRAPYLARLQSNVVGSLREQLDELLDSLEPDVVTLETLPPELTEIMVAIDGRQRVTAYPKQDLDLNEPRELDRFIDGVMAVSPDGTGPAVNIIEWGRVTAGAMQQAMGIGTLATAIFLFFLWRNLWDTALAFFPLALAGLVTVATMVLAGWHFDFANVIVLPMLLGMGIDNGVHLVHRHRTNPDEHDVLASSTARAVFFAALTTILAFGSLAFAPHRGMASLGRMLTLGVGLTLISYVVVLPAVLAWDDQRAKRRAARTAAAAEAEAKA